MSGVLNRNYKASPGQSPKKGGNQDEGKANEDLINFLEHKLEEIEKKLSTT